MKLTELAFVCVAFASAACATSGGSGDDDDTPQPVCGDGVCAAGEVNTCDADCGSHSAEVCGNSTCEGNEVTTCPGDCCGDGTCDMGKGETWQACFADCAASFSCTQDEKDGCGKLECTLGGQCPAGFTLDTCALCVTGCWGALPNGVCDPGETATSCVLDCFMI